MKGVVLELNNHRRLILLFICLIAVFLVSCSTKHPKQMVLKDLNKDPIGLITNEIVINTFFDEVIRPQEINRIDLVAEKGKAPFFDNLSIIIDGTRYPLDGAMKGYYPSLTLDDFTRDGIKDLLFTIRTGESDRSIFYALFYFKQRQWLSLGSPLHYQGIVPFECSWNTDFEMQIQSPTINLMTRKKMEFQNVSFIRSKIGVSKYIDLQSADVDSDGQFELVGMQSIWLKMPHHVVFKVKTVLKFSEEKWRLIEYQIIPAKETAP